MEPDWSWLDRVINFVSGKVPATVIVTLVTAGVIGALMLVESPLGCSTGLRNRMQCAQTPVAQPFPTFAPITNYANPPEASAGTIYPNNPPASGNQGPFNPPASGEPAPFNPPASQAYPPGNLHSPNLPPYEFDTGASGAYAVGPLMPSGGAPYDLGLSCRLPVYAGGPGSGGFLVLPDHTFIPDPRSGVTLPTPPGGATPPPQYGYGGPVFGLSYDRALGKWLPVQRQWVAPDGLHYAYPDLSSGIYVIDAASSAQVEIGEGKRWQLLDVGNTSVYAEESQQAGLWQLPFAGAPRQISTTGYWQGVGGGAAYGTATSAVPAGVATRIVRLDLATGATTDWFQVDGAQPNLAGFDNAGHPLFLLWASGQNYLWIVYGLGNATVLVSGFFNGPIVGDAHGIWMSGSQVTVLVVPSIGPVVVANIGGQVAGECS